MIRSKNATEGFSTPHPSEVDSKMTVSDAVRRLGFEGDAVAEALELGDCSAASVIGIVRATK
jgi:hypothetical protein